MSNENQFGTCVSLPREFTIKANSSVIFENRHFLKIAHNVFLSKQSRLSILKSSLFSRTPPPAVQKTIPKAVVAFGKTNSTFMLENCNFLEIATRPQTPIV